MEGYEKDAEAVRMALGGVNWSQQRWARGGRMPGGPPLITSPEGPGPDAGAILLWYPRTQEMVRCLHSTSTYPNKVTVAPVASS